MTKPIAAIAAQIGKAVGNGELAMIMENKYDTHHISCSIEEFVQRASYVTAIQVIISCVKMDYRDKPFDVQYEYVELYAKIVRTVANMIAESYMEAQ